MYCPTGVIKPRGRELKTRDLITRRGDSLANNGSTSGSAHGQRGSRAKHSYPPGTGGAKKQQAASRNLKSQQGRDGRSSARRK